MVAHRLAEGNGVFAQNLRSLGPGARRVVVQPAVYYAFVLLMVLNIAIPKGGIAVGSVPVTFGYMAFLAMAPLGLLFVLNHGRASEVASANFLLGYVPFGALALLKLAYVGTSFALLLYATLLVVFPVIMLLIYAPVLEALSEKQIRLPIVWSVRFIVIWGLLNFIVFALTRDLIEIPYVTVNPLDLDGIYQKNNRRGILMKLVGTYNNGNLFGVCVVMLFPIYVYFEKSRAFIVACALALVLTLSRTVWFGMAAMVAFMTMLRLIRAGRPGVWLAGVVVALIGIAMTPLMGWTPDRVIDTDMGGRMLYWDELELSMFGGSDVKIREVLYASLLQSFGLFGTMLALIALGFPLIYGIARLDQLTPLRRSALVGVAAYFFMAFSDAAFIYPPTMLIFLFVVAMLYRRGPENSKQAPVQEADRERQARGPLSLAQAARLVR